MARKGRVQGKIAIVTGGGKGIGLAIARALKSKGARVSIISRSAPDTGDAFFRTAADVSDEASISDAFSNAARRTGPLQFL